MKIKHNDNQDFAISGTLVKQTTTSQQQRRPTIFVNAGGTGGHIFPALAVANDLATNYNIIWVGGSGGLEGKTVKEHGFFLTTINMGGVRAKGYKKWFMLPFRLTKACYQAFVLLRRYRPELVISFGGYVTVPLGLMARLFNYPLIIHEQNKIAGLSNRLLSKIATRVLVGFSGVLNSTKTIVVGNPLRQAVIDISCKNRYNNINNNATADNREAINVLILGGSLGARFFNDNLPQLLSKCDNIGTIIHQTGKNADLSLLRSKYTGQAVVVLQEFIDDIASAYLNSDLIICRAGAMTVSEVAAASLAAIFIPYPYAVDDHQYFNALTLAQASAAIIIKEHEFVAKNFIKLVGSLTKTRCRQMGQSAATCAILNSTSRIRAIVQNVIPITKYTPPT